MVAYSFAPRFAPLVEFGTKTQTIRAHRQGPHGRHGRPGETLQLYAGMRTRQCRLLRTATCASVQACEILLSCLSDDPPADPIVRLDGHDVADVQAFARADGFADFAEMIGWWFDTHGPHDFAGVLIRWTLDP